MRLLWIVTALLGGLVALFATLTTQINAMDARLQYHVRDVLHAATDIADDARKALAAIQALPTKPCSDADLNALRFIVSSSLYMQDTGRSQGGRIICTAIWGVMDEPIPMGPPDRTTEFQEHLWKDAAVVPDRRLTSDMAMAKDALTFTRKNVDHGYGNMPKGARALLVTRDKAHIFHSFGMDAPGLLDVMYARNKPFSLSGRHHTVCDTVLNICAIGAVDLPEEGLQRSLAITLSITLLGLLAGGGAGYAVENRIRASRDLGMQLRRALKYKRFGIAYQPIVRLRDRQVIGVEALARWNNEDGHPVSPDVFVPEIEKMGLLYVLTQITVSKVLTELGSILRERPDFYVSINVGVSDLICEGFQSYLIEATNRHGVNPERIALEITERGATDMSVLAAAVAGLRAQGFRLFIDDFGTGYSGLAYLVNMPVDAVKIDRMFTSAVGTDSLHARMLHQMCGMIVDVQGKIVVEGVETEAQAELLAQLYPDANAQGWLFGKPVEGTDSLRKGHTA